MLGHMPPHTVAVSLGASGSFSVQQSTILFRIVWSLSTKRASALGPLSKRSSGPGRLLSLKFLSLLL